MELLITIATVAMALSPLLGWTYKVVTDKIQTNKEVTDKKMEQMDTDLRAMHRKEDAHREFARVDRDFTNLRDDVSKGFDRIYETMKQNKEEYTASMRQNKEELLQAIQNIRK